MNLDYLRSLVRSGLDETRKRAENLKPVESIKKFARDALNRERTLSEAELSSALASASGVSAVSVSIRRGALQVHATFDELEPLSCTVDFSAVRFAPQGAKELAFRVEPAEASSHRGLRPLLGMLSNAIAHSLWSMVLGPLPKKSDAAPVDRDAPGHFRIDLRNLERVREAQQRGFGLVIDNFALSRITLEAQQLVLTIGIPGI